MKLRSLLPAALIAGLLAITLLARAQNVKTTDGAASSPTTSCPMGGCCFLAAATPEKNPTVETCVVSGDRLGEMGKPFEYTYKEAGKPDRVILLCCKDCVKDFEKEPAKYLKKLDEAAAAKKQPAPKA